MGPIGVKAHLAPFLARPSRNGGSATTVSAAPYGSPSILPISWSYCLMMGGEGLTQATAVAILNANYIAKRLAGALPGALHRAPKDASRMNASSTRGPCSKAGVSVDDIAKRLIDYGFHPPTMSWPVAGTLMVEPTSRRRKRRLTVFATQCWQSAKRREPSGQGRMDKVEQSFKERSAHRRGPRSGMGQALFSRGGLLSGRRLSGRQILAARQPRGQRLRRSHLVLRCAPLGNLHQGEPNRPPPICMGPARPEAR